MFDSEPEPELNDRVMYQPRGKVLGGTSSINGMVYMRGNAADYDEWRQRGCDGWDYDSVLPYFKKAEDNQRGGDQFHGTGGPLKVQDHRWQSPSPAPCTMPRSKPAFPPRPTSTAPSKRASAITRPPSTTRAAGRARAPTSRTPRAAATSPSPPRRTPPG